MEELRFGVLGNWLLRRIFESKKTEVAGRLRKLHSEELHALGFQPDIRKVNIQQIK